MKQQTLPFMSVVISCYNGAATLSHTLESLLAQDYPRDRFEIIVVDDGSTDTTPQVVKAYPTVRYIRQDPRVKGVSAARNLALQHVQGEVCVNFDDDTIATPDWLRELARGYIKLPRDRVAGIAGQMVPPSQLHGLVDHYMAVTGCGNPVPLSLDSSRGPWQRFIAYLKDRFANPDRPATGTIIAVREINGANASFPVEVLRTVGGWDSDCTGVEDTDICRRIAIAFPDRIFYAVPSAHMIHDPKLTFWQYIRRPYRRGAVTLRYYRRNGMTPPVFPFPLLTLMTTLIALLFSPWLAVATLASMPQLLYGWWPLRAIREHNLHFLAFPYIQMSEETAVIAGLIRGYILGERAVDQRGGRA